MAFISVLFQSPELVA